MFISAAIFCIVASVRVCEQVDYGQQPIGLCPAEQADSDHGDGIVASLTALSTKQTPAGLPANALCAGFAGEQYARRGTDRHCQCKGDRGNVGVAGVQPPAATTKATGYWMHYGGDVKVARVASDTHTHGSPRLPPAWRTGQGAGAVRGKASNQWCGGARPHCGERVDCPHFDCRSHVCGRRGKADNAQPFAWGWTAGNYGGRGLRVWTAAAAAAVVAVSDCGGLGTVD